MLIKELTEQEKKDAVNFMEGVVNMSYEEFEQWKKDNTGWMDYLLNWCRIRKDYPELNKIREEKFVLPDRRKRRERNKQNILAEMSRKKAQFITEHMIPESEVNRIEDGKKALTYRIIHHKKVYGDESLVLALPFDSINLMVPKFGAAVEFYKSQCPEFFEEVLNNFKKYDGSAIVQSNAEKYNKRF